MLVAGAGCGSSGATLHDASVVRTCLSEKGFPVEDDLDNPFAPSSRDFRISFAEADVFLSVSDTADAAAAVEQNVTAAAAVLGGSDADIVRRNGNVVYYTSSERFPDGVTTDINSCL